MKVSVWYHQLEKIHVKLGEQLDQLGVEIEGIQITEGYHKIQTGTQTEQPQTDQPQEVEAALEQPASDQPASEQPASELAQQYDEHSEITEAAKGLLDLTGLGSPSASRDVEEMEIGNERDVSQDKTKQAIERANLGEKTKCFIFDKVLQLKPPKITQVETFVREDQMVDASSLFNPLSSITTPSAQIQPVQPFSPSMFQTPPSASIPGFYQAGTGSQDIVSSTATVIRSYTSNHSFNYGDSFPFCTFSTTCLPISTMFLTTSNHTNNSMRLRINSNQSIFIKSTSSNLNHYINPASAIS